MRGHNRCFHSEIRKIISELSSILLFFGATSPKLPKKLDTSYKIDLDFWDCFGMEYPSWGRIKQLVYRCGVILDEKTHQISK